MNNLILVNPVASYLRKNPKLQRHIYTEFFQQATIAINHLETDLELMLKDLKSDPNLSTTTIYVVGGDGTFNKVLNWVVSLPENIRPLIISVGGGEFNFMARFCGFTSGNPLTNLREYFKRQTYRKFVNWRPLRIHDSLSDSAKFGAVLANGVVADVTKWYAETGKGSVTGVVKTIALASLDSAFFTLMGTAGRVRKTKGVLTFDPNTPNAFTLPTEKYPCMMVGAVDELLATCRPFKEPIPEELCGAMAYWGPLQNLVPSVLPIWLGRRSPLSDPFMFNRHSTVIELVTADRQTMIDGEVVTWPIVDHSMQERTFTISRGPAITLLRM